MEFSELSSQLFNESTMKKIHVIYLGICLLAVSCVTKSKYLSLRASYQDSLAVARKEMRNDRDKIIKLEQVVVLFRQQAERYKEQFKQFEDSLLQSRREIAFLRQDTTVDVRLLDQYTQLKKAYQKLSSDFQLISAKNEYLAASQTELIGQIKAMQDSLDFLESALQKTYITPYNSGKRLKMYNNTFDCYVVDISKCKVQLFWKNRTGDKYRSFKNLQYDLLEEDKLLLFATNAGMFTPRNSPQGLYVENGQELIPIDLRESDNGNFYMKPNGVFLIDTTGKAHVIPSEDFVKFKNKVTYATQSGPMLLKNGEIHPYFTPGSDNKYIRSGVGVINEKQIVFIISHQPVNFYDFASLFKDYFHCKNALYLDGAISKMFLPELGRFDLGGDFGPLIGIIK